MFCFISLILFLLCSGNLKPANPQQKTDKQNNVEIEKESSQPPKYSQIIIGKQPDWENETKSLFSPNFPLLQTAPTK